ncbi:vWA domain-containing protein [Algihabitans albus]|uniref:vWA domain-containing protein n=1 Tax=Algihabitans albus TaxID=2164067 RepID=UPI0013C2E7BC|nr:vWA domain-containing protein [Algihabitans albus]
MTYRRPDAVFLVLAAACLLATLAAFEPRLTRERALRDVLFVVDVTQSMNARDMTVGGRPASRLDHVKDVLPKLLSTLPCGSRAGLAIFAERRSLTFIEPIEICENYAPLTEAISTLTWRMAWEGDSFVVQALHHALARAVNLGVDLVFLTDGHEAPPLPRSGIPGYAGDPNDVGGLILGVGGTTPVPIPRYDDTGRETGVFEQDDVQQYPRRGSLPSADAATRPGYHPSSDLDGETDLARREHLSALQAAYLQALAASVGLAYFDAELGGEAFLAALSRHTEPRRILAPMGVAWAPAAAALALALFSYALSALRRHRWRRPSSPTEATGRPR